MTPSFAFLMLALALALTHPGRCADDAAQAVAAGDQVVEFTDDTRLHGRVVRLAADELVLQRNDTKEPLVFSLRDIRRIVLRPRLPAAESKANATLQLRGGGWIAGDLQAFEQGGFQVRIGNVANVEIRREKVKWLALSPSGSPDGYDGLRGIMGLAGWESGGDWEATDAGLVARSAPTPITRKFDVLSEKVDIEFDAGDVGPRSGQSAMSVLLGSGGAGNVFGKGFTQLQMQSNMITGNSSDGQANKNFTAKVAAENGVPGVPKLTHYRILHDRRSGKLVIFVNGRKSAEWAALPPKSVPQGGSIMFQPNSWSQGSVWTLANMRVRPWDGDVEPDGKPEESAKDRLSTGGPEKNVGSLEGISKEAVRFSGKEFPRKDALFIRIAGKDAAEPAPGAVARLLLAQRGEFDVASLAIRDGGIQVRTAFSGELSLPLTAISSVEFPHPPPAEAMPGATDRLLFKNGDSLHGSLQAAASDRIAWRIERNTDVGFQAAGIAGVLLARPAVPSDAKENAAVRFRNGDWLSGEFAGIDAKQVRLKVPQTGDLQFDRATVSSLYFGADGRIPVADGSTERDSWMRGPAVNNGNVRVQKSVWRYFDGSFSTVSPGPNGWNDGSNQTLGRTFARLPEKVELSFDVSASNGRPAFSLQLFGDPNRGGGLMIEYQANNLTVMDLSPAGNGFQRQPTSVRIGNAGPAGNRLPFRILADRKTGQMAVFVNGKLATSYPPRNGKNSPKPAKTIFFTLRDPKLTIANLWIAPWAGAMPRMPKDKAASEAGATAKPAESEPAPADFVSLLNGDETPGTVDSATREEIRLKCDVGEIELPLKRVRMLGFAGTPKPAAPGIRLRFAGKGLLTVESFQLLDGRVSCRGSIAGDLSFPVALLSEIGLWSPAGKPFMGVALAPLQPRKLAPAPALASLKLDVAALDRTPRTYEVIREDDDSTFGVVLTKTDMGDNAILLESESKMRRGSVVTCRIIAAKDATLRIAQAVAETVRGERKTILTMTVKGVSGTMKSEVGPAKSVERPVDYPANTTTLLSLARIVTLLPKTEGGIWAIDRVFEDFKMRIHPGTAYRLECAGKEEVEHGDTARMLTRFTLRTEERTVADYFLDDVGVVQRMDFETGESMRLRPDQE